MKGMSKGEEFVIESDKIALLSDIPAWCHLTGNQLIKSDTSDGIFRFQIMKMVERSKGSG